MAEKTLKVTVGGRVQGVGYRDFVRREAEREGVRGWVVNRPDGSVEALLCGPDIAVEKVLTQMRSGPPGAEVKALDSLPSEDTPAPGFTIKAAP